jgi:lipopolysaccharide transport system ATP-binding protein
MAEETVIRVKNLSKVYKLYDRPIDRLKESVLPLKKSYHRDFYALHDVSFEIKKGEVVGIIGENGSGKSTLLKMITGVLTQTSGSIETKGKISALLELGAGFNGEYTGIENVYLSGTIMGYSKKEMDARLPAILEFADIGDFVNYPVKTYSSGMFVRLAFSVAINVDPDILIVDEALAVGDDLFQRKCYAKFEEFKKQGKTILFVSHSGQTIVDLCTKAILFDQGELLNQGYDCSRLVNLYHKMLYASEEKRNSVRNEIKDQKIDRRKLKEKCEDVNQNINSNEEKIYNNEYFDDKLVNKNTINYEKRGAEIFDCKILNHRGQQVNVLNPNREYYWAYKVKFYENLSNVNFGMMIKTIKGLELGGATAYLLRNGIEEVFKGEEYQVKFLFQTNLADGIYFLNCGVLSISKGNEMFMDRKIDVYAFRINSQINSLKTGIIDFQVESKVRRIIENEI